MLIKCNHDPKFQGAIGYVNESTGCVACEMEQLREDRNSWRRVAERLEREKQSIESTKESVIEAARILRSWSNCEFESKEEKAAKLLGILEACCDDRDGSCN